MNNNNRDRKEKEYVGETANGESTNKIMKVRDMLSAYLQKDTFPLLLTHVTC